MDVTDEAQVDAGMDTVAAKLGGIDILVSNAGVQIVDPLESLDFGDWKKLLAIILAGASLTPRPYIRPMYPQTRRGTVISLTTVNSTTSPRLKAPYSPPTHGSMR